VADQDAQLRRRLRALLNTDPSIETVGEAGDGELALQLLRWLKPDVALLEDDLPSFGGAAIARVVARELPEVRVVIMTKAMAGVA
jgi:DNA-binding NarL/FixJ family response regulator